MAQRKLSSLPLLGQFRVRIYIRLYLVPFGLDNIVAFRGGLYLRITKPLFKFFNGRALRVKCVRIGLEAFNCLVDMPGASVDTTVPRGSIKRISSVKTPSADACATCFRSVSSGECEKKRGRERLLLRAYEKRARTHLASAERCCAFEQPM